MTEELPKTIQELETPCMLVDIDKVKRNCQRMIDRCQEMGLELRPHMKTHKTMYIDSHFKIKYKWFF